MYNDHVDWFWFLGRVRERGEAPPPPPQAVSLGQIMQKVKNDKNAKKLTPCFDCRFVTSGVDLLPSGSL